MKRIWRCAGPGLPACSLLACSLLAGSTAVRAQSGGAGTAASEPRLKDDLFAGTEKFAQNASSVTEVDMDPDTLGMVGGRNSNRARHTLLSVVHTYTYDKPGMYNVADVDAYRTKLNTGDWHCSVHVREMKSGESTDVCRHHRSDGLDESAIITVEPKSLTFIHTIRRPYAEGEKPGGEGSVSILPLILPLAGDLDGDLAGDLPLGLNGAGTQANAALMRAQGAILRAQMAAVRPEIAASMAEMHADLAEMHVTIHGAEDRDRVLLRISPDGEHSHRDGRQEPGIAPPPPARSTQPTP